MKTEIEITVLVTTDYETLNKQLINQNFKIKEQYQLNDVYMIDKNINLKSLKPLEILKKCILVRDIADIEKELLYKYKEYDSNGDIVKQGKVKCIIDDIQSGINFMEAINYEKLLTINDTCIVYSNEDIELVVQLVNNKYIFIELENREENVGNYDDIVNALKEKIKSLNISIDKTDYFVKKAEIILKEVLEEKNF